MQFQSDAPSFPWLGASHKIARTVSKRLKSAVRSSDLVARMGGDEFTVILRNLREEENAGLVARKILQKMQQPIQIREHQLSVTASIGVAVAPRDGQEVETLQKHADQAMYQAKSNGKNGVQMFRT